MDFIWNSITDWLKEVLVSGIVSNLSGMFDSTNEQIGQIAGQVGLTPQAWNSGIFNMIQNLSNNVILPPGRSDSGSRHDPGADSAHYRPQ